MKTASLSRRDFLQLSAVSLGTLAAPRHDISAQPGEKTVAIVIEPTDALAASPPVTLAVRELEEALARHGLAVRQVQSIQQSSPALSCIVVAAADGALASATLQRASVRVPRMPESLALVPAMLDGRPGVLACGSDSRGLMYAVRELADRVRHSSEPVGALRPQKPVIEQPFTATRGIGRLFVSDVEDRPWFEDREFWPGYLSMLASQRFNRLHLAFGISYDSLQGVTDSYLLFAYPFFLSTAGYPVRAAGFADEERDRNLQRLQFISNQAVAHGLDFQLGIWTHGYQWSDSPHANYTIEGLSPENHAAYCRDSLAELLRACPAISGVTLRTHGESGVREGSYAFWGTVFDGVAQSGRRVEIDLHTKGLDQKMIDRALATGMPVRLSPKYWAEHVGMPYHQAAIRELEMPREHSEPEAFSALSTGSRSFTRYGYADFLREDRPYSVMYRVWPGTHRLLLSGDPRTAAAHAHALRFCGGNGAEFFEPLSFKGRRGSGIAGGRCAYADSSLTPSRDWEKYLYTYRLWGRLLYDPDADPKTWRRYLHTQFQGKAAAVEAALANASRILPIVTTAHMPSAANDTYVPELYTNQPIADATAPHPYGDTPSPKVFGNVSPLDPQLFSSIGEFVNECVSGQGTGKYSPIEVAQWLEDLAAEAERHLREAATEGSSAELRRVSIDVQLQSGLGRFYAAKLRSGTLYALHARLGSRAALERSLQEYRHARTIWAELAQGPGKAYVPDVTIGPLPHQRGHWLDRLPSIDRDIAATVAQLEVAVADAADHAPLIEAALGKPSRGASLSCQHLPPPHFVAGEPLMLAVSVPKDARLSSVRMYYRHVDQAEGYQVTELAEQGNEYRALVPSSYTASSYPLQYFFELLPPSGRPHLYPGFTPERANQPYFLVRVRRDGVT
jgi:hypothetical protein